MEQKSSMDYMMSPFRWEELRHGLATLGKACFEISSDHGFWPNGTRNKGEAIALMHQELSEQLEAVRKPRPDEHCPQFSSEEIEAADLLIRLVDYCHGFGLRLPEALQAKFEFNINRPFKHGKGF